MVLPTAMNDTRHPLNGPGCCGCCARALELEGPSPAHALLILNSSITQTLAEQHDGLVEALREADRLVSVIHDRIYDATFDRKAASDAVWAVHAVLRGAAEGKTSE